MPDAAMIDPQDAIRAAINVLRDSAACDRMPSGLILTPAAGDVHDRAADCLEGMLEGMRLDAELVRWRTAFFARCDAHHARLDALLAEFAAERKEREKGKVSDG